MKKTTEESKYQYRIVFAVHAVDEEAQLDFERGYLGYIINKAVEDYSGWGIRVKKDITDDCITTTFITQEKWVFDMLSGDFKRYCETLEDRYVKKYGMLKDFSIKKHIVTNY